MKIFQVFTFVLLLCVPSLLIAQEAEDGFVPAYILVHRVHLANQGDIDFEDWKATEIEFYNKVTAKNDLILHAGVYVHYLTPNSSELLFLSVYDSFADFENALQINEELIQEGWESEDERNAFFEKQQTFYSGFYSDEMYSTLPYYKDVLEDSKEPMIIHLRKHAIGEGGSGYDAYFNHVIMKNKYVKGFYTMKHLLGGNNYDAYEVSILKDLSDLEKSFKEEKKLLEKLYPDEQERKDFLREYVKIFSKHGDFVYKNVPELAK
ncbi:hypothetical protein KH5_02490 [Urechidicola sp. KH5]